VDEYTRQRQRQRKVFIQIQINKYFIVDIAAEMVTTIQILDTVLQGPGSLMQFIALNLVPRSIYWEIFFQHPVKSLPKNAL
jgi:hypothetical protein